MKKLTFILILFMLSGLNKSISYAQGTLKQDSLSNLKQSHTGYTEMMENPQQYTFKEIQKASNDFFEKNPELKDGGKKEAAEEFEGAYYQYKMWEWFTESHLMPDGKVANVAAKNYEEFKKVDAGKKRNANGTQKVAASHWQDLGPNDYTLTGGWNGGVGRVNCIAFHPTDINTIWVGTPAGGLWKTLNHGSSWSPLTDNLPNLGVSGIAVNPTNTNEIYILTGDGDHGYTYSTGVMKSTDGGKTWAQTGLFQWGTQDFKRGYKLMMHPANPNILFVASTIGIYKTINAGVSWSKVQDGYFYDMEFKPGNPAVMYAVTSNQFYRSVNTGKTWSVVTSGLPAFTNSLRLAIAVTADSSSKVYLAEAEASDGGFKLYISKNSGTSFTLKNQYPNCPNPMGINLNGQDSATQAGYDFTLSALPNSANRIFVGGVNVWKSLNGGTDWSIATFWDQSSIPPGMGYNHADQHAMEINPLNKYLYSGSDGGIYYSPDSGITWNSITHGLGITQIYRLSPIDNIAGGYYFGTQDNGCDFLSSGSANMNHIRGGDAVETISKNNWVYSLYLNGDDINAYSGNPVTGGVANWTDINPDDGGYVFTPFMINPKSDSIYVGYDTLWVSSNPTLGKSGWNKIPNTGLSDGKYRSIAMTPANTSNIYASDGVNIFKYDIQGINSVVNINASMPVFTGNARISSFCIAPDSVSDGNKIWVALSGYSPTQKVFYTKDGGTTWADFHNGLPNVPVNCIAVVPNDSLDLVFCGTDLGVYYLDNTMLKWEPFNDGLPNVIVEDLEVDTINKTLTAGTFGRGIWQSPINDCAVMAPKKPKIISSGGNIMCVGENLTLSTDTKCATQFLWSTSETTASIHITASGTYTVTVSNDYGTADSTSLRICNTGDYCNSVEKTFGGSRGAEPVAFVAGLTGNYFCAANTKSNDGDVSGYHDSYPNHSNYYNDMWVVNMSSKFEILWQKCLGGTDQENIRDIVATRDSGCIVVGSSRSHDEIPEVHGYSSDYWIVKLDKNGNTEWNRAIGTYNEDIAYSVIEQPVGGYLVLGTAQGGGGDILCNPTSYFNAFLVQLDFNGTVLSTGCLSSPAAYKSWGTLIENTSDGGFVALVGNKVSVDNGCGINYYSIFKYDSQMLLQWEHCFNNSFDGNGADNLQLYYYTNALIQTSDNGYVFIRKPVLTPTYLCDPNYASGITMYKIDSLGNAEWTKCLPDFQHPVNSNDGNFLLTKIDAACPDYNVVDKYDLQGNLLASECIANSFDPYGLGIDILERNAGALVMLASTLDLYPPNGYVGECGISQATQSCPAPSIGFQTINIATTSALLKWTTRPCAISYKVQYRKKGASTWLTANVTTNLGKRKLTGLAQNQKYEWRVQSVCSTLSSSEFSPIQEFTTLAPARDILGDGDQQIVINIYPNPTNGIFTISISTEEDAETKIEVYNELLQLKYIEFFKITAGENTKELTLSSLQQGIYFVKATFNNTIKSIKLVKY